VNNDKLQEEIENILYGIQNNAGNSHLFSTDLCTEAAKEIISAISDNSRLAKLRNAEELFTGWAKSYGKRNESIDMGTVANYSSFLDKQIKQEG
jgi:hypothetical protein